MQAINFSCELPAKQHDCHRSFNIWIHIRLTSFMIRKENDGGPRWPHRTKKTFNICNERLSWAWTSYQIRKIAGCACAGNAGNVFPRRRFQRKPIVGDPGMHHGTCVTHVPWCMSGSLTCGDGENVPGIPGACAPAILRIWQEAHPMISATSLEKPTKLSLLNCAEGT